MEEVHKMHFQKITEDLLKGWSEGFPVSAQPHEFKVMYDDNVPTFGTFKVSLSTGDIRHAPHIIHYVKNPEHIDDGDFFKRRSHLAILVQSPYPIVTVCFLKAGEVFGDPALSLKSEMKTPNKKYNLLFITEIVGSEDLGVQRILRANKETVLGIVNNISDHKQKIDN